MSFLLEDRPIRTTNADLRFPSSQIDGNMIHGCLPFAAPRARYCLRRGLPRPRSGGRQPLLLVEQGQPLAAAMALQSKRGRSQGREAPRNEGEAPRNEGSLDAQAERRLPGTDVRGRIRGEFVRAPPLHPFLNNRAMAALRPAARLFKTGGQCARKAWSKRMEVAPETSRSNPG